MAGGAGRNINIGGRNFALDGENEISKQLSGFTNEVKPNGDTVTSRLVKSVKTGMLENVPVIIDPIRRDLEYLQDIADGNSFVDVDLTEVDGVIYSGSMQIEGDVKMSNKESICELTLKGTLEQQ
jgi:hypothetical protein